MILGCNDSANFLHQLTVTTGSFHLFTYVHQAMIDDRDLANLGTSSKKTFAIALSLVCNGTLYCLQHYFLWGRKAAAASSIGWLVAIVCLNGTVWTMDVQWYSVQHAFCIYVIVWYDMNIRSVPLRNLADKYVSEHAVRASDLCPGQVSGKGQYKKWLPSALLRAA